MRASRLGIGILCVGMLFLSGCDSVDYEGQDIQTEEMIAAMVDKNSMKVTTETTREATTETTTEATTETPKKTVTISFAGDCTLGGYEGQGSGGQFIDYYNQYGNSFFMANVKDIFENDDITFVNLEGALTSQPLVVDKEFPIKGEPEYVNVLTEGSIEVCNITNNHIMDCGTSGFQETIGLLSANDIEYCGEGYSCQTEVDGVTVSCLGYSVWGDSKWLRDQIQAEIEAEREKGSQIVCIMFHYGTEKENYSNAVQESISHFAIDSGADIVVGSHPHVIQGIEEYKGKVICYSLGNFSFGANRNPADKDTFIFQQTFLVEEDGTVSYGESNVVPCSISSKQNCNTYQPTPLVGEDAERVIERLRQYSSTYEDTIF